MLLTFSSFLFWGRQQGTYVTMVLSGISIALLSFIVIIIKDSRKGKWVWVAIVCAAIILQRLTEPILIKLSFQILLYSNKELFSESNRILTSKPTEIYYWDKGSFDTSKLFTQIEKQNIATLFGRTEILYISKNKDQVYYETYGLLDARIGMSYFYNGLTPTARLRKIYGWWYY
jgi:hypothetical protein